MSAGRFNGWAAVLVAVMVMLMASAAFAQDLPKIAVYVTGNVGADEKEALGTRILTSLVNSGRYMAIERSNAFLAEIDKEHIKQRSGAIDDSQISELGKQFGVKFVCIAAITPAFGDYQVSARIIDVETAVVVAMGDTNSPLKSLDDLTDASNKIVAIMFEGVTQVQETIPVQQTRETGSASAVKEKKAGRYKEPDGMPRILKRGIRLEVGGIWGYLSSNTAHNNNRYSESGMGGGAYDYFDLIYAEIVGNTTRIGIGPDGVGFIGNVGILGKYPFGNEIIKVSPLLGIGMIAVNDSLDHLGSGLNIFGGPVTLGGRIDVGMSEIAYLRSELLLCFGSGSATLFKIGGGFDIGLGESKKAYLRPELLYHYIGASDSYDKGSWHMFDIHVGIGYKW